MDLFDFSKPLKRQVIKGSQTRGYMAPSLESSRDEDFIPVGKKGKDYVKEHLMKEQANSTDAPQPFDPTTGKYLPHSSSYSQVDDLTSTGECVANLNDFNAEKAHINVYHRYKFDQTPPPHLSVSKHREKILNTINSYRVTVIQGATGCGKTTQVPQFILNSYAERQEYCNIVVTQPRRLAAMSVAHRVAFERDCEIGTLVGYQIGQDKKADRTNNETRLLFCTTGVLLEKLINSKSLDDYTHIMLDEVHERDQETDFLLIVLKKLMNRSPRTRIILMSATLEGEKLAQYFPIVLYGKNEPAPIVDVGEKQNFDVKIFYLDDLQRLNPNLEKPDYGKPGIKDDMIMLAIQLLKIFDHIEKNDVRSNYITTPRGSVLVFLPGYLEIERLFNAINSDKENLEKEEKWKIEVLHSSVTVGEQEAALKHPVPPDHRKIFLSTNIAESSLTIKDVRYVIDFCLTKQLMCEAGSAFTHLQLCWASHSNCTQRAGRVGRVNAGKVYRLVYKEFYEIDMPPRLQPEICVNPLDRVVLKAKILDMGPPVAILAAALDPPDLNNIEMTVASLKEMGALLPTVNGKYQPDDGDLTFAGKVMSDLPLDPRLSKLILLGHVFCVLDDCIKIACAMSNKSLFCTPFMEKFKSYEAKLQWSNASSSDPIASLNAFSVWETRISQNFFSGGKGSAEEAEKRWARSNFLQVQPLRATHHLYGEVEKRLSRLHIRKAVNKAVKMTEGEKAMMLKMAVAGAFYPQYFVRGCGVGIDEKEALKTLNNHDPFSTVYLQGLPNDQPCGLYIKEIKKLLAPCASPDSIRVTHDSSSKIYVQFQHPNYDNPDKPVGSFYGKPKYPGRIHTSVYAALKLRQLRVPLKLQLLHPEEAQAIAQDLNLIKSVNQCFGKNFADVKQEFVSFLPAGEQKEMSVSVTHVEDPEHFWVIYRTETIRDLLSTIQAILNKPGNLVDPDRIIIGNLYAVSFREAEELYYRARILHSTPKPDSRGKPVFQYKVYFIDYGNQCIVNKDEIKSFGPGTLKDLMECKGEETRMEDIPEVAIECSLAEIKPSLVKSPSGLWSVEAIETFKSLTLNEDFQALIYSVVYGKVAVELVKLTAPGVPIDLSDTINSFLVKEGLAERGEEGLMSKMDNYRRQSLQNSPTSFTIDDSTSAPYAKLWDISEDVNVEDFATRRRTRVITLKGPASPLEMKVFPVCRGVQRKGVSIEPNSVNSVLLDPEPQNPNDRLLVAASVGTNESGDNLTLRDTTLMPNIRGLTGLVCLMFSPTAELRVNKQRTKLTGALCGLGYDPETNQPHYPANDLEISFDAEFTLNDIGLINKVRYWLNSVFCNAGGEDILRSLVYQAQIKDKLLQLLKRKRRYQNLDSDAKAFKWNCLSQENVIDYDDYQSFTDEEIVFKFHSGVKLINREPAEYLKEMRLNLCELYKISKNDIKDYSDGVCKLCNNVILLNRMSVRIHLTSPEHRENEIRVFKENLEDFKELSHYKTSVTRQRSSTDSFGQAGETATRYTPRSRTPYGNNSNYKEPRFQKNHY